MKAPIPALDHGLDVLTAVQQVYMNGGIDRNMAKPGIVPLYDLIGAYPIRVAELRDLTYRSAAEFLVAEIGQTVPTPHVAERPLAGFLYSYEYAGLFYAVILVKKNDPIVRRRFSAAHELGHYVLHFLPLLGGQATAIPPESLILAEGLTYDESETRDDMPEGQIAFTRGGQPDRNARVNGIQQMEHEANQFAAELLMPAQACMVLSQYHSRRCGNKRRTLARRLAGEFLVSQSAMQWRLTSLGLPGSLTDVTAGSLSH